MSDLTEGQGNQSHEHAGFHPHVNRAPGSKVGETRGLIVGDPGVAASKRSFRNTHADSMCASPKALASGRFRSTGSSRSFERLVARLVKVSLSKASNHSISQAEIVECQEPMRMDVA